jgi:hypothetical protein
MFFYGVDATKKPTAAPLGADNTYRSPFLCPQEESDLRAFIRKTPGIAYQRRRTSQEHAGMGPDSNSLPGAGWLLATSP